jgi:1-acyl-sn-glycerol-3-phosphate acyltransferase
MLFQALRSLVFYFLFLGQTVVLAIFLGTMAQFRSGWFGFGWTVARYWAWCNMMLLRFLVGIRSEVAGLDNIPEGGCIIASKHQSDWDIFAILPHTGKPAFIAKKELMDIPFFGWAARTLETITIDRKRGSDAIPAMLADARGAVARGCRIIIFPEGTRGAPLMPGSYKFGTAKLYEALDVPLVPVAVNSGLFWGRNSLILWPGTARATFLPPIPPGLPAPEMQRRMIAAIEAETDRLALVADKDRIARPLTAAMRAHLDRLREDRAAM